MTVEQARHLLAVAKDDPLEALYVLALTTGLRQGELLALTWSDLDLTYGKLQVQRTLLGVSEGKAKVGVPKTPASRRSIHLTDLAIEALIRHQDRQRLPPKKRGRSQRVRHSFQPLLVKAGLPPMRFHDLRHSTATLLLTLGVHPKIVQE